jgi:hypothetical protein
MEDEFSQVIITNRILRQKEGGRPLILCSSNRRIGKYILFSIIILFSISCVRGFSQNKRAQSDILMEFRMYFYENDITAINDYLEQGNDPNKCRGSYGWIEENPLWIALNSDGDNIKTINLLISYGANVNLRPYIWHAIDNRILTADDIAWLEDVQDDEDERAVVGTTEELMYKKVEILINAGADVNAKGARNRILFPSTDEVYKIYFEKEGNRPVNYAIKKNLHHIVDLLLNYTLLDEDSLIAASESGDSQMVEKINKLYKIQQETQSLRTGI